MEPLGSTEYLNFLRLKNLLGLRPVFCAYKNSGMFLTRFSKYQFLNFFHFSVNLLLSFSTNQHPKFVYRTKSLQFALDNNLNFFLEFFCIRVLFLSFERVQINDSFDYLYFLIITESSLWNQIHSTRASQFSGSECFSNFRLFFATAPILVWC